MISCRVWWPWMKLGYITMTRRQSKNQWNGGISVHPTQKKNRVLKSAVKFLASIFCDQDSFLLIIFQRTKLPTRNITHLCWCNWRTFRRKNATGNSPRGSCSSTKMPRLTGHLRPWRNWPTGAYNILITQPILRIWPRRTTTCSLDWKKTIEKLPFFVRRGGHCCRGDLVGRTRVLIFFWVAYKT